MEYELDAKLQNKMKRAAKMFEEVRLEVERQYPDKLVGYYLDGTANLNLMVEPTGAWSPDPNNVLHSIRIIRASGGDW